ncbi:MAG TPA: ribulose-phosphate 3-epimerase [Dehalococcoidia bacterium]|nr:ribulose-phosphate 3-epimerase [Dehalococcoidia bacterium]
MAANANAVKIAPSILAADFARLGEQVQAIEAAGADWVHVDAMDGQFVPNITFGPLIAAAVKRSSALPIDLHAMIAEPERQIRAFADAGASLLTVHAEATVHLHRLVHDIKHAGMLAGVAVNPATPLDAVKWIAPDLDLLLVMSINPGWGGQKFLALALPKLHEARRLLDAAGSTAELEVDGGVDTETAAACVAAGATVLVAGTAVFGAAVGIPAAIRRLRDAAAAAVQRIV